MSDGRIAILGGGNLGQALALGWTRHGGVPADDVMVTRRRPEHATLLLGGDVKVSADNPAAVDDADIVILAVQPQQLPALLEEIRGSLPGTRLIVSVASGVALESIREALGTDVPVVRAMPNTGASIGASMTCLSADDADEDALQDAAALFERLGRTLVIQENMMTPATALCACGVAFFLRCVRAASQGGIEVGFHPEEALLLAAQTAHGAAALLLEGEGHPEREIDRVTTPRGCTIAGLNEMEHYGLSSALIRGIKLSADRAAGLAD
ncbi:MAG: pyrroline-5-carboxylate reductase [Gemmatimonadota bacterium]|nr:pyrroline-5-carboxylate reductase [Gemmatimonadota bacterium]